MKNYRRKVEAFAILKIVKQRLRVCRERGRRSIADWTVKGDEILTLLCQTVTRNGVEKQKYEIYVEYQMGNSLNTVHQGRTGANFSQDVAYHYKKRCQVCVTWVCNFDIG